MSPSNDIIVAFVSGVLGPIIVLIGKHYLEAKVTKKKDIIKESCNLNTQVEEKLERIREKFDADRVWISQVHNGGHFLPTGKSIQKFSMFYEIVKTGVPSVKYKFQNIPLSLFTKSTNELIENDQIIIPSYVDDSINKYGLTDIGEIAGCKSTYLFSMKDIHGRYFGTFGVEYTLGEKTLKKADIQELGRSGALIAGVLNVNHNE